MDDSSTLNKLVLLAYGELADDERSALLKEIINNTDMAAKLNEILAVKEDLDKQTCKPSDTSLRIVLNHSRNSHELETLC